MKNFQIFLILIVTSACASKETSIYEFDPQVINGETISLSDIASDIKYIPLDNKIQLNRIIKIVITENDIYLSSRNQGILRYDRDGIFKNNIGNIGRGPKEYLFYQTFCVDNKSGYLYNLSDQNEKVQVFSKDGQFLRSFTLKEYGTSIGALLFSNYRIYAQCDINYDNAEYDWIVYDTIGNIIRKQPRHLPKFITNYGSLENPYIYQDRVTYFGAWYDTIFSIMPDLSETPLMVISSGEFRYPRSFVTAEEFSQKKFLALQNIFETSKYIIIKYFYQNYYLAFIKKNDYTTFVNRLEYDETSGAYLSGIKNDIDGGLWFLPQASYSFKGKEHLIGIVYPYQLIAYVNGQAFKSSTPLSLSKKKEFEELTRKVNEMDNPILVLVELKK